MSYFGIDLGTTNSLIGNAHTGYLSDLVPSCVDMTTHEAGAFEYTNPNAERSFKVNMSLGTEGALPRQASADVLKALRHMTGDSATDVVISVPAYFSDNQRQATIEAAKAAGFNVHGLVNEPTAAAMFIAQKKRGLFVVMDLGGGTFDVSLIDSRFGLYDVQATDGRIIGGDNLDFLIMQYLIKHAGVPFHKLNKDEKNAFRIACAGYKKQITTNYGKPTVVDCSMFKGNAAYKFPVNDYVSLMKMAFEKTITLTKDIIKHYIPDNEKFEILLVGGSTKCPYYRKWVEDEIGVKPEELTYDSDRVVAQGAALYAKLLEEGKIDEQVSDVTKTLSIGLADGTCEVLVEANSKVPLSVETIVANDIKNDKLTLELYQGDSLLKKENELIGELVFDYGKEVEPHEGLVYVTLSISHAGIITFECKESLGDPVRIVLDRKKV